MPIVTKFSVKDIQLILRDSWMFDQRSDIIVPNVSWGLLRYEADLVAVNRRNYLTEVEIKRSFEDFKADFKKDHKHDDPLVGTFYYCVPKAIVEKVVSFLYEHYDVDPSVERSSKVCPAVVYFTEEGGLGTVTEPNFPQHEFGTAHRKIRKTLTEEQKATLGRLASLRYWTDEKELRTECGLSAKDLKIKKLNEQIKALELENKNLKHRILEILDEPKSLELLEESDRVARLKETVEWYRSLVKW